MQIALNCLELTVIKELNFSLNFDESMQILVPRQKFCNRRCKFTFYLVILCIHTITQHWNSIQCININRWLFIIYVIYHNVRKIIFASDG